MTLVEILEKNAREIPEKTAIIFHNTKINYRELNETVNKLANSLMDMGFGKGDRVGLMLPRIPELVIGFLAVAKSQGIAVPINFELTEENIKAILNSISPRYIIAHSQFLDLVSRSVPYNLQIQIVVVGDPDKKCILWNDLLKKETRIIQTSILEITILSISILPPGPQVIPKEL